MDDVFTEMNMPHVLDVTYSVIPDNELESYFMDVSDKHGILEDFDIDDGIDFF